MDDINTEEIEQRLKAVRLRTSADLDARVRALCSGALAGRMRPRLRKLAAAAAMACLVALAAWWLLSGRDPMPSAYADLTRVLEDSQNAERLHARGTVAGEEFEFWFSMSPFTGFVKRGDRVQAFDAQARREYEYDPTTRIVTVKYMADAPSEALQGRTILGAVMHQLDRAQEEGAIEVSTAEQVTAGKTYTVYTLTTTKEGYQAVLTVDTSMQRLVKMESETPGGPGPFLIEFDYPQTIPADIYAVGVPRDAKVVRVVERLPKQDIVDLCEGIEAARDRFAPTYYAVIYRGSLDSQGSPELTEVQVLYKKDGRRRMERYPLYPSEMLDREALKQIRRLAPPDDMAALETWVKTRMAREVYFSGLSWHSEGVRVWRDREGALKRKECRGSLQTAEGYAWSHPPSRTEAAMLPAKDGPWGRLVGTESTRQATVWEGDIYFPERTRRYWNPERDYCWEEAERLWDTNAPWQVDKDWTKDADPERVQYRWQLDMSELKDFRRTTTERVVEYGRTPQGQWYAKKILTHTERNTARGVVPGIVVIHLDTEREIPDGLLDPASIGSPESFALWPHPW